MYNHHLTTFLQVADSGSFMKAGEKMYISANAVTKQINLLEQHLGIKLFHRSKKGLALTEAGKLIYKETKAMIKRSDSVLQKAKELENNKQFVIRIGVSLMNTSKLLLEQWAKASDEYPNIKLQIVPYEDSANEFFEIIDHFGKNIDVIPGAYNSELWKERCNTFHLQDLPLCIAVPKGHRLASYPMLSLSDLHGEKLIVTQRGFAGYMDTIRDELEQNHPKIEFQDIAYYEYSTFNQAVADQVAMISASCYADVHPLLVTIPVDWDYTMPYGLLYAKEPAKEVLQFIMAIGKVN